MQIFGDHAKFLVLNLAQEKNPCVLNKKSESRYSAFGSLFLNKVGSKFSDPRVGPLRETFEIIYGIFFKHPSGGSLDPRIDPLGGGRNRPQKFSTSRKQWVFGVISPYKTPKTFKVFVLKLQLACLFPTNISALGRKTHYS